MVTEDELKATTCPTRRYCVNEAEVIQHNAPPLYTDAPCLGSACAAFRRHEERLFHDGEGLTRIRRAGVHCGLGGSPEVDL